ncbi:serine hydrolase domain-containing protein [Streptosporangium sp. NPDC051023]|uniref:serine hydrolase domain-containing protein n=1 Tax=Streptosporangium sp. NPDC051023 TaxID=3155410 RepID=UPI00344EAC93
MRPYWTRAAAASALAASLTVAAAFPAAAAATPSVAWSDTKAQRAQLQQLARNLVNAGAPGVIVRVDDGSGQPIEIAEQATWTRQDHLLKAGDEFRVGSTTKTMVATLLLQLVAEGKLALTDPVEKWLPGKVPNGKAITLRMLLNHTSGLFDYTQDAVIRPSILGTDRRRWTSAKLLAVGVKHDPLFAPGAKWSYSNTNYAAVGAVLEQVTGAGLAELIRDRIARPLNLKHTYYPTDSTWRGSHAHGYELDAAHMPPAVPAEFRHFAGTAHHDHVDVSDNDPGWGGAAGAVVSTAQDWSRFYTALMSGKLLPAAQLAQMRTTVPVDPQQPDGPGYGLGIQTAATPCGTFWGHDGGIPGYLTTHLTDRTGGRTATVLISTEYWAEYEADPKIAKAAQALQSAVTCTMFGKPVPTAAHAG